MRWLSVLLWSLVGLAAAAFGCLAGGLLGSFWPQTVVATAAAGAVVGYLTGRKRLIVITISAAALVSCVGFFLGTLAVSALLAWPLAALAIALAILPALPGRRAKIVAILSAPILGGAGFIFGAALVAVIGLSLDNSQWVARFMIGGAAGFGFLVLAGMRLATGRISR